MASQAANALSLQNTIADPSMGRPADLLQLQRSAGNRAVNHLIQTKLTVGSAGDSYEQEADRVADQVLSMPRSASGPRGEAKRLQRQEDEEEVQTKPLIGLAPIQLRPRAGGGFDPGPEVESSLAAHRGTGRPLPGSVRDFMEPRFGADFSGIRLHTGSEAAQLSSGLRAQAFTHGRDIYLGAGAPAPGSEAGNRLLAHELAHTIQQGASTSRTRPAGPLAAAASTVAMGTVQRKAAYVREKTHARSVPTLDRTLTLLTQLRTIEKSAMGKLYAPLEKAEVEDQDTEHVKDEEGKNVIWYKVKQPSGQAGPGQFLRATKVVVSRPPTTKEERKARAEQAQTSAETYDTASAVIEALGPPTDVLGMEEATQSMQAIAGGLGAASGVLGMALGIRKVWVSGPLTLAAVEGYFQAGQGLTQTGSGIAGSIVAGTGADTTTLSKASSAGEKAGAAGAFFESFTGTLRSILALGQLIGKLLEMGKMLIDDKKYTKKEYADHAIESAQFLLDAAGGALSSSKNIISLVKDVPVGLDQAVPGLDIALSAIKLIINGYYTIESIVHLYKMSKTETQLQQEVEEKEAALVKRQTSVIVDPAQAKAKVSSARSFYQEQEAIIATNRDLIKQSDIKITDLKAKQAKITGTDQKAQDKRAAFQVRIWRQENFQKQYRENITAADKAVKEKEEGKPGSPRDVLTREELGELELSTELATGNKKRIIRQIIHIGSELAKIAASITQIATGATGVGAAVAVTIKAGAAGVDLGLPFLRAVKQFGRAQAAKQVARGAAKGTTKTTSVFNFQKATAAKLQARKGHAVKILDMAAHLPLPTADQTTDPTGYQKQKVEFDLRAKRVEDYIRATGVSPDAVYRLNGDPVAQIQLLAQELAQREFKAG